MSKIFCICTGRYFNAFRKSSVIVNRNDKIDKMIKYLNIFYAIVNFEFNFIYIYGTTKMLSFCCKKLHL